MSDKFAARRSRHVLLTGATGFLGTALLEALLRETDARITLLVRPTRDRTAHARVGALLLSDAFTPLRKKLGPLMPATLLRRIDVVSGDLSGLQPRVPGAPAMVTLPKGIDTVIHSASNVDFDDDLSTAFAANVEGPAALYRALSDYAGSPHVIHVSTAYVNAGRVRVGLEQAVLHDVDWRLELARLRENPGLATDPAAGRRHARRNGWTDTYTFSKALGERVAEECWAQRGHRLTVLRPAIIESALARPFPGWLDGFKVADPLIAAYAEGKLTDFPGRARGVIDIVPVDAVVDTVLAAMSRPPLSGRPRYLQVASSRVNPLRLREIQPLISASLTERGWPDGNEHHRPMRYHSRLRILTGMSLARSRVRLRSALRGSDAQARAKQRVLDRISKYAELYAPYTCNPTTFDMTGTAALLETFRRGGRAAVDLGSLDWRHYLSDVHVPALGAQRRWWREPADFTAAAVTRQAHVAARVAAGHTVTRMRDEAMHQLAG